jgi:hypothetical protein
MITVSNLLDMDHVNMSYDVKNIEKGLVGVSFPSQMHKLMVEELSRLVRADVNKVRSICSCVLKVPARLIESVTLTDLINTYGLKVD